MLTKVLIGIVILVLVIRRQLGARPLSGRIFLMPLAVLVYALYVTAEVPQMDAGAWTLLLVGLVVSVGVGLVQGRFVHVYPSATGWMVAGSLYSLLFWVVSIPIRYGIRFGAAYVIPTHVQFTGHETIVPYLYSIAGLLIGRALMITLRYPQQIQQALNVRVK